MPSTAIKVSYRGCGMYKGFHTVKSVSYACFHVAWAEPSTPWERHVCIDCPVMLCTTCCFILRAVLDLEEFFIFSLLYDFNNSLFKKKKPKETEIPSSFLESSATHSTSWFSWKENGGFVYVPLKWQLLDRFGRRQQEKRASGKWHNILAYTSAKASSFSPAHVHFVLVILS